MNRNHILRPPTRREPAWATTRAVAQRLRALSPARRAGVNPEAGAALVEFALILPLFLLMVFLVFDVGRAINYWIDETHLASEGARLAAVNASPGGDIKSYIRSQADTKELRDGGSDSISDPLKVCIDFPTDPEDGTTREVGDPVQVTVSTTYKWLPIIGANVTSSTIKGSATHRLERPPTYTAGCTP
jgi:Flp pilus assembly protein TadG